MMSKEMYQVYLKCFIIITDLGTDKNNICARAEIICSI